MNPEELYAIRARTKRGLSALVYDDRRALLSEVDRLNAELAEARLATEEAWDAYDNVLEEKRSR